MMGARLVTGEPVLSVSVGRPHLCKFVPRAGRIHGNNPARLSGTLIALAIRCAATSERTIKRLESLLRDPKVNEAMAALSRPYRATASPSRLRSSFGFSALANAAIMVFDVSSKCTASNRQARPRRGPAPRPSAARGGPPSRDRRPEEHARGAGNGRTGPATSRKT